ncbi:hypothetical protein KCP76_17045 [Salmonella enterica subsp. enterica serovar Weltevreden]|nr:hypothetical protein KCP76_17045 [Salmonella enterica subsp. enterica serovar Weltevreden]
MVYNITFRNIPSLHAGWPPANPDSRGVLILWTTNPRVSSHQRTPPGSLPAIDAPVVASGATVRRITALPTIKGSRWKWSDVAKVLSYVARRCISANRNAETVAAQNEPF